MNLKSRKLLASAICFITATVFVVIGKAEFDGWSDFIKWVVAIYTVGNVGEHYTGKIGNK